MACGVASPLCLAHNPAAADLSSAAVATAGHARTEKQGPLRGCHVIPDATLVGSLLLFAPGIKRVLHRRNDRSGVRAARCRRRAVPSKKSRTDELIASMESACRNGGGWDPSQVQVDVRGLTFLPCVSSAELVLKSVEWPKEWPFKPKDFTRQDETDDFVFYAEPSLEINADDLFERALQEHYASVFARYPLAKILDLCAGWMSHYPKEKCWSHVSILGMNEEELKRNARADEYIAQDLNAQPALPYLNESFDVVTCALSLDYLTQPLQVMREVQRVLKPGGAVVLSTSKQSYHPSKVINIWLRTNSLEHVLIYGSYIHYADGFEAPEAHDLTGVLAKGAGVGDPLYVVQACKKGGTQTEALDCSSSDALEEPGSSIPGLLDWLETRGLRQHLGDVEAWAQEMGAVDFVEIAENSEELADFLGNKLSKKEQEQLLQGTRCNREQRQ